jgi:hypothetical protein
VQGEEATLTATNENPIIPSTSTGPTENRGGKGNGGKSQSNKPKPKYYTGPGGKTTAKVM